MPEIEKSTRTETVSQASPTAVRETRFDPAHELPRAGAKAEIRSTDVVSAVAAAVPTAFSEPTSQPAIASALPPDGTSWAQAGAISPELIQQFRLQAQQLAAHLDSRQRDLDRREAELHARIAQQETASRNARLWFQQRAIELDDRQSDVEKREQQIVDRLVDVDERLDAQASSVRNSVNEQQQLAQAISFHQDEVVLRDLELQRRQEELNDFALQVNKRLDHCREHEQKLQERERLLESAEAALARSQVEWDDQQRQHQQHWAELQARLQHQQAKTSDQQGRIELEIQKQREALSARADHLERRAAALDQLRTDLLRIQRETLEMRLAAEELWAELSGIAPPASLTQSLARLRAQLSENFRLQAADVTAQRAESEQLAGDVARQHQLLVAQKNDWQQSVAAQQREVDGLAVRLAAREEELDRQADRQQQARQEWDSQRHQFESEIRRLQSDLRRRDEESCRRV
jgi:hypothetical protein